MGQLTRLKHVQQTTGTSCGPACVAIAASSDHDTAVEAMFGPVPRKSQRSTYKEIKAALAKLGVNHSMRAVRCATLSRIDDVAIVSCSKSSTSGNWHFVVYDACQQIVYDPLKTSPVPASRFRKKPFSYLRLFLQ